jgi:hypothetical protein
MPAARTEWRNKITAWQRSGLSMAAWCRTNNEGYDRFIYWRNRLQESEPAPAGKFLPLTLAATPITLECHGISVHVTAGFDPQLLKDILSLLKGW